MQTVATKKSKQKKIIRKYYLIEQMYEKFKR